MSKLQRSLVPMVVITLCLGAIRTVPLRGEDQPRATKKMHGLINKLITVEGKRDDLIAILVQANKELPGCLSYVVAKDPANATTLWVTEVWEDQASHKASLALAGVKEAITKGRPMIAKFEQSVVTEPVGGHGLVPVKGR